MSTPRASKNNVLAGVFVLGSLTAAIIVVAILTNFSDFVTPKERYTVRFGALDGAEGLDKGSPVKLGGQRVGAVEAWEFAYDETTQEPEAVDVRIAIRKGIRLYTDADVQLIKPLLGGQSSINISPNPGKYAITDVSGPARLLEPNVKGATLKGRLGGPGFLAPADYARLRTVLANFEAISGTIKDEAPAIIAGAKGTLTTVQKAADEAAGMLADARPIIADVRAAWPAWRDNVTSVLAGIEREVKNAEGLSKRLNDGIEDVRGVVASVRASIEENAPKVNQAIENTRAIIEQFRNKDYQTVVDALEAGRDTMREARDAAQRVNAFITEKRPELEELVSSANLAGQQLKLAVGEIRASPWRLLYQPSKKELENELLYSSVRQYSSAVSELRAAAEALRSVSERPGTDPALVNRLSEKLRTAFDQYQEQERAFLDRWAKDGK